MKRLHLFSWDKDTDKELSDIITWDNDYDLKLKTDNYFDKKNRLFYPNNSWWSFYTTDELTPSEQEVIGVQYGTELNEKEFEDYNEERFLLNLGLGKYNYKQFLFDKRGK